MGELVQFDSEAGKSTGYLSIPPGGEGPPLLLCHAWWGLNSFFTGLADRLASEGFVVLAPDLYGGRTASTIEDATTLIRSLNSDEGIKKEQAALDYLLKHAASRGAKAGAIGFSMGAAYATWLSTLRPEIAAVVLFYGGGEQSEQFPTWTNAALLGHFAPNDEWEPEEETHKLEAAMHSAGKEATFHFYPGTGHWFFEDNRPDVYDAEASALAWERTLAFLHNKLG